MSASARRQAVLSPGTPEVARLGRLVPGKDRTCPGMIRVS